MKHCAVCAQEFEDRVTACSECGAPLREGPRPADEEGPGGGMAPLAVFPTETEARMAILRLEEAGIRAEYVALGSPGLLGAAIEGASTGAPVVVEPGRREEALAILASEDEEAAEILGEMSLEVARHAAVAEGDDPDPEPVGGGQDHRDPRWLAAIVTLLAIDAAVFGSLALAAADGSKYPFALPMAEVAGLTLVVGFVVWLARVRRNTIAFGAHVDAVGVKLPPTWTQVPVGWLPALLITMTEVRPVVAFHRQVLGRPLRLPWVHLGPLAAILGAGLARLAATADVVERSPLASPIAMTAGVLLIVAAVATERTARVLSAANREIAGRLGW